MHWTTKFLAAGYKLGAQGPDLFDCWSFFRTVQREQFGRDLPFLPTPTSIGGVARVIAGKAEEFGWRPIDQAEAREGDGVFMSFLTDPTHIGVWVPEIARGSVLHCPKGGAGLHDLFHLKTAGWRIRQFYRFEGAR